MKMIKPTVGDMIRALNELDSSAPFLIDDPDTSWTIHTFELVTRSDGVWMVAEYSDMDSKRPEWLK